VISDSNSDTTPESLADLRQESAQQETSSEQVLTAAAKLATIIYLFNMDGWQADLQCDLR
jgi:hypothetical protein